LFTENLAERSPRLGEWFEEEALAEGLPADDREQTGHMRASALDSSG